MRCVHRATAAEPARPAAPLATPWPSTKPCGSASPDAPFPAAMPATCVPWPSVSAPATAAARASTANAKRPARSACIVVAVVGVDAGVADRDRHAGAVDAERREVRGVAGDRRRVRRRRAVEVLEDDLRAALVLEHGRVHRVDPAHVVACGDRWAAPRWAAVARDAAEQRRTSLGRDAPHRAAELRHERGHDASTSPSARTPISTASMGPRPRSGADLRIAGRAAPG